ncbi:hypothetical protein GQ55_9G486600 [Panicum hallii var. hallii]|uniref:Uncharacterized protein n=1 Tax=Panicum hallii var. hallii TaxID=1504633 RepID=A0A2T7CD04_9POAL|nr:hypothetical protein GQ55_9G486600 [Panicum hallii var. hallii]
MPSWACGGAADPAARLRRIWPRGCGRGGVGGLAAPRSRGRIARIRRRRAMRPGVPPARRRTATWRGERRRRRAAEVCGV